jgi:hypothetical protein
VLSRIDFVGAGLLGAGVLCVLLPLVQAETGGLSRLGWLFALAVVLLVLFVCWEYRIVRLNRAPLLDPRLARDTPGYPAGAALGMLYFVGFSGIWLVFALYFQAGLGYSPLQSGLVVTPFALGSAVSAAVAGRLVSRYGRRLTVLGLSCVAVGLVAAALVLRYVPAGSVGWMIVLPLLVAGLGGGAVISPNTTLTLESVPVRMAGTAAGALQTGQRIGAAVGTAVLATVFYAMVPAGYRGRVHRSRPGGRPARAARPAATATARRRRARSPPVRRALGLSRLRCGARPGTQHLWTKGDRWLAGRNCWDRGRRDQHRQRTYSSPSSSSWPTSGGGTRSESGGSALTISTRST